MGYVGFLLTWIPFLRRQLFQPFQPSLLADAKLNNFDEKSYFSSSRVVNNPNSKQTLTITAALPNIKGQTVLIGDSGLGKSMFLRHLAKTSQTTVVYLPLINTYPYLYIFGHLGRKTDGIKFFPLEAPCGLE